VRGFVSQSFNPLCALVLRASGFTGMIRFTAASISHLAAATAPRLESADGAPSSPLLCAVRLSTRLEKAVLMLTHVFLVVFLTIESIQEVTLLLKRWTGELAVVFLIVSFALRFSLVSNRTFDRKFWCSGV